MTTEPFGGWFRGRRVFVTGHTGFKGGWLSLWLARLGAQVHGYALAPPEGPGLFREAGIERAITSHVTGDVRDAGRLASALHAAQPECVFHLAAQPLVREAHRMPRETWEVNVLGTVNLLEGLRDLPSVRVVQVCTSDKCYDNREWTYAYRETDALGGNEPYAGSKAAAEIACMAWRSSFFDAAYGGPSLATVRAGNVLGGGDFAPDRIVPDCVRALSAREPIVLRHPGAVRPWQHVLEPLAGYLMLAARQAADPARFAQAFNFGPHPAGCRPVAEVVQVFVRAFGRADWRVTGETTSAADAAHEAGLLMLDSTKASTLLGWRPLLDFEEGVAWVARWYRAFGERQPARVLMERDIEAYEARLAAHEAVHKRMNPNESGRAA